MLLRHRKTLLVRCQGAANFFPFRRFRMCVTGFEMTRGRFIRNVCMAPRAGVGWEIPSEKYKGLAHLREVPMLCLGNEVFLTRLRCGVEGQSSRSTPVAATVEGGARRRIPRVGYNTRLRTMSSMMRTQLKHTFYRHGRTAGLRTPSATSPTNHFSVVRGDI